MALEESRFFDSVGGDRKYSADQFAEYFRVFLTSGIKNGGSNLQVTADGTSMAVTVDYGAAMLYGYSYFLKDNGTGKYSAAISPSGTQHRIDRVVIRLNRQLATRDTAITVIKGEENLNPTPPDIVRNGNTFDISLAQVRVPANAVVIRADDVTDERLDQDVCGLINSLITLDTAQLEAEFDAFMATIAQESPVLHQQVVNNLTTTEQGYVLDARQGPNIAGTLANQQTAIEDNAGAISTVSSGLQTHAADMLLHNQPGALQLWPGQTAPAGWLGCDGSAVSRTTYADLFAVIGTTYGQGDGSTTFNLPDLTGRVVLGADGTYTLGSTGGAASHTLVETELPTITGTIDAYAGDAGLIRYASGCFTPQTQKAAPVNVDAYAQVVSYNSTKLSIGGGQAFDTLPPYTAMHYIIKY